MVAPVNPLTTSIHNYLEFRNQNLIRMGLMRNMFLYAQFLGLWIGMSGIHTDINTKVEAQRMFQEGKPREEIVEYYNRGSSAALGKCILGLAVSGVSCW